MDSLVLEDSPLAQYLEAEGTRDPDEASKLDTEASSDSLPEFHLRFAPQGTATIRARLKNKLPAKLQLEIPSRTATKKLQNAWLRTINARMGHADSRRFLEHFRYIIIASQLLNENPGPSALRPNVPQLDDPTEGLPTLRNQQILPASVAGAAVTAIGAFILVWLINWARPSPTTGLSKSRIFGVFVVLSLISIVAYIFARRQWLQSLRREAVESVSTLVTHIQGFDASTSSALLLIQEVELVARGYRVSSPLPPVTRLEEKAQTSQNRRCQRLRKALRTSFTTVIPQLEESYNRALCNLATENDFEKYLDMYEIGDQDLEEAGLGLGDFEPDEMESLKILKLYHYRLNVLLRMTLCSFLALEADGGKHDFSRWRTALEIMNSIILTTARATKSLVDILDQEEQFNVPPTPAKAVPPSPSRERLRNQIRKLTSLSQGIRGLQAKMQILREESNKTLEASEDITELGSTLMQQYESIGADLKSLQQAWEEGKKSLAINIDRHERRVSLASSGLRSPAPSLGGLTAVDESSIDGSPGDALRALNGEPPGLSSTTSATSESDEEVFEAIALPRQRTLLSREERIAKMHKDRERRASLMEKRNAETNMLKELESVISLRQPKKVATTGRITSI
ncbi:MAG: hypothetical protein M1822_002298 [Bathelium mastoideum]|nr:MAG: hypothetical protein M1822_002298 [Bathelium mastoideum]